jgi:hypothetical protein
MVAALSRRIRCLNGAAHRRHSRSFDCARELFPLFGQSRPEDAVFCLQSYGRELSATLGPSTQIVGVTHPARVADPICGPDTPSKLFMVPRPPHSNA